MKPRAGAGADRGPRTRELASATKPARKKRSGVLPGFRPALAFTAIYLLVIVLVPLGGLFAKTATMPWGDLYAEVTAPRAVASYQLSFTCSLIAAAVNAFFGLVVAWVLARYRFAGRSIIDALVDLPFALPTAVAGLTLTALYANNGWLGQWLEPIGIQVAFTRLGIVVALTFIGLPFVVRTVQPVIEELDPAVEEAAMVLGASRWQTFTKVVFPTIVPALTTGFTLAFARALGEYGSIVFISGNLPMKTEITPLLIVTELEQYNYAGATALALVMLLASFVLLLGINLSQRWAASRRAQEA
jgi:sulfate transport system permease protein